ncbi:hypothetical protein ABT330_34140 [Streptomyces sp. NPDC000658]|uniref:hypothetical protein n=1 Tax=Streptomyces sp. NPDC000658 TaxID=3154266 RepID=UPI00332D1686
MRTVHVRPVSPADLTPRAVAPPTGDRRGLGLAVLAVVSVPAAPARPANRRRSSAGHRGRS